MGEQPWCRASAVAGYLQLRSQQTRGSTTAFPSGSPSTAGAMGEALLLRRPSPLVQDADRPERDSLSDLLGVDSLDVNGPSLKLRGIDEAAA